MKQAGLAKSLDTTPVWFCAVKNGREDAGKNLAAKAAETIGGTAEIWMLKKNRAKRKPLVDNYLAAFKSARSGGKK